MNMNRILAIAIVSLILAVYIYPDTYFIDYNSGNDSNDGRTKTMPWKRCPGMVGFSGSYSHQAGDIFIFRGGVRWPASVLPLSISYSGSSGARDEYRSDPTWYAGAAFEQPLLDAEGSETQLLVAHQRSYFKVEGLEFLGYGTAGVGNNGRGIEWDGVSNATFANCVVAPNSWLGLYILQSRSGTSRDLVIQGNEISSAAMGIVLSTAAANAIMEQVDIVDNRIHDLTSQLVGSVHGDGIHTWTSPSTDATQSVRNVRIYNNTFEGDFSGAGVTAFIYLEYNTENCQIFNNVFQYTAPLDISAFIYMKGNLSKTGIGGGHVVHNNTMIVDPLDTSPKIGVVVNGSPGVVLQNNILEGFRYSYYFDSDSTSTASVDYNLVHPTTTVVGQWGSVALNWSQWQSYGNDVHGIQSDPSLLTGTAQLSNTSVCIDAGIEMSHLSPDSAFDKNFRPRPIGITWDIGAYESEEVQTIPKAPSGLRVNE